VVAVAVRGRGAEWRLEGSWPDVAAANRFLEHLRIRSFAPATVRAYAYDVLCFARFCAERELRLAEVVPADLFDWIAWQAEGRRPTAGNVVRLTRYAGAAPSSVNRRVAAVRALFEHQVVLGVRAENPVPAPRRGQGLRAKSRGVLGHLGPGRPRGGGRLVRAPHRLPEALDAGEVAAYLRVERPPGLATPECFVVGEGATAGGPLTEAGLRSVFRHHRRTSGAMRGRPHRLRHTYGTELAAAGIDLRNRGTRHRHARRRPDGRDEPVRRDHRSLHGPGDRALAAVPFGAAATAHRRHRLVAASGCESRHLPVRVDARMYRSENTRRCATSSAVR